MNYIKNLKAVVLLEDGTLFTGKAVTDKEFTSFGEICFNTGMTGYQEIFTDPSYFGQIMLTTNAHIGNYGINTNESESSSIKISGLVCKNFSYHPSRVDSHLSLEEFLHQNQIHAVSDIDTRALTEYIRVHGAMNAVISTATEHIDDLKNQLAQHPSMAGLELSSKVSTTKAYEIQPDQDSNCRVAVLDLGIKENILRHLKARGCHLKVFPWNTSYEEMLDFQPDAFFLSNGPGDPKTLKSVKDVVLTILDNDFPLFGICLGHQIISLAMGINTFKMHHGHRGINHPVKNLITGKSEITSQNHGFSVSYEEAEKHPEVEITHIHLNDNSVAGIRLKNKDCFSVQYHPEAGPGPNDATYLFDDFVQMIQQKKN
ncbi:MAG: glutamine-hydrolyzing carbamoyl-phosphate synthase small subunit [Flavobacteriaceae bacterium]|nr:glutamine-hydrolyzing carbamoyl-phosphate synthase small subunit [Flavobacteriaceae bacterium]